MTQLVDPAIIEKKVGVSRHPTVHFGREVYSEDRFYILHSQACVDSTPDLRTCQFSLALDSYRRQDWDARPIALDVTPNGRLIQRTWRWPA